MQHVDRNVYKFHVNESRAYFFGAMSTVRTVLTEFYLFFQSSDVPYAIAIEKETRLLTVISFPLGGMVCLYANLY